MKRIIIPYNPNLKQRARELRNNSTQTEIMLWNELRNRKLLGYDFHRQKPIGDYIVDFFCAELMLAIEIDGESHIFNEAKDMRRQKELEEMGIRFLRFDDMNVRYDLEKIYNSIETWVKNNM